MKKLFFTLTFVFMLFPGLTYANENFKVVKHCISVFPKHYCFIQENITNDDHRFFVTKESLEALSKFPEFNELNNMQEFDVTFEVVTDEVFKSISQEVSTTLGYQCNCNKMRMPEDPVRCGLAVVGTGVAAGVAVGVSAGPVAGAIVGVATAAGTYGSTDACKPEKPEKRDRN